MSAEPKVHDELAAVIAAELLAVPAHQSRRFEIIARIFVKVALTAIKADKNLRGKQAEHLGIATFTFCETVKFEARKAIARA